VVQREDLRTTHVRTGFTITLFFAVLLAGLIWLCAPAIAGFFRLEGLTSVERALSLVFPLQGLSVVAESLLQRSLRFRCLAIAELISVVLSFGVIGIVLALLGFGVWALVGAHIAQSVFKTTVLLVARPHPMLPQLNPKASAELMYFGGGFTAARLGNHLAGCVDNLVIGRWLGADALGVYGRAYQLVTGPAALFGGVLDRVLFPVMARLQSYPDRLATAFRCGVALVAFAVLPLSTLAFFLAPELIRVVLGPQWDHAVLPFQILTLGLTFRTSYKLSDSLVRATGAVYRRAWRQFAHAAFVFFGALVGQNWGLSGAAVGVLVAIAVNFLLMAHLSLNLVQLTWRSFCEAHFPALALAAFVGTQVWASAHILRAHEVAPVLVLILSTAAPMPSLLLVWCFPRVFLGREGLWLFRTLAAYRTP
jgi:PST family polysaccharide transporter